MRDIFLLIILKRDKKNSSLRLPPRKTHKLKRKLDKKKIKIKKTKDKTKDKTLNKLI